LNNYEWQKMIESAASQSRLSRMPAAATDGEGERRIQRLINALYSDMREAIEIRDQQMIRAIGGE
jgi:hypothetical protein